MQYDRRKRNDEISIGDLILYFGDSVDDSIDKKIDGYREGLLPIRKMISL